MKNILIVAILTLFVAPVHAQNMLTTEEAKLYEGVVGGLYISNFNEFEEYCSPLKLLERLKDHPRVLEKAGMWCENTRSAWKYVAKEQAIDELSSAGKYVSGCDEIAKESDAEEHAKNSIVHAKHGGLSVFNFWKAVYKFTFICTPDMAKKAHGTVVPGEPTQVK